MGLHSHIRIRGPLTRLHFILYRYGSYFSNFFALRAVSTTSSARTFRITNRCDQMLWLGIQGKPLIYNGGFNVNAQSSKDISVPDGWVSLKSILVL